MDIIGNKYGILTVLEKLDDYVSPSGGRHEKYLCLCDCGNTKEVLKEHILSGATKSCGCLRTGRATSEWHDYIGTRIYRIWGNMVNRCTNSNNPAYDKYGGRGIYVCDEWKSFENFLNWANSSGYTEELTIDRVDNNGGYCPENCRWATNVEQANNKRSNHYVEYKGETKTIAQWADELSIPYKVLHNRIKSLGWDIERAFTQPIRQHVS